LGIREGKTLFSVLLTGFFSLLHRYSGLLDITLGTPVAGRSRSELEALIGLFVNTLPLRLQLSPTSSFRDSLSSVHHLALDSFAHQDVPFEKLVEALLPSRRLNVSPLVQVMFALQNAPMPLAPLQGLRMDPLPVDTGSARFDLTLIASDEPRGLRLSAEYRSSLFDEATVSRLLGHFRNLLQGAVLDAGQSLSALPLMDEAERRQVLVEWNDTHASLPD
ncbi:non-ribosomal peptide synthetase, partial [Myxococcaceae bacterium JPH2]|nr:non-ribosomal peptide synthetase [Myxococcaceae bacterium JPH2]